MQHDFRTSFSHLTMGSCLLTTDCYLGWLDYHFVPFFAAWSYCRVPSLAWMDDLQVHIVLLVL